MAIVLVAVATVASCDRLPRRAAVPVSVSATSCSGITGAPVTLTYGQVDPDRQQVIVWPPPDACGSRPVLFWIHGGGWRIGSHSRRLEAKRELAARHGWAFVSIGYRLSTATSDVRWPDHGEDVAAAIATTLDHAEDLGVDPDHVAVMGHSAGGQLAAIVTVDPDLLRAVGHDRDEIDCLVSLDTEGYDLTRGGRGPTALVEHAFGSDPSVLAQASPTTVLREEGGPVAAALLVTRGLPRRQQQARDFATAVEGAGSTAQVVTATGYSHAEVNRVVGDPTDAVVGAPVEAFLGDCLGAPSPAP